MEIKKIAIIGGGNLGGAIAEGLVRSEAFEPSNITVTRRKLHLIEGLNKKGVKITSSNTEAVKDADMVFLVVKPYQVEDIIKEIRPLLNPKKILISFVAGVNLETLEAAAGEDIPMFRAMPNTAIALCESMTCLSLLPKWSEYQDTVSALFDKLGKTAVINEELMSAATVLGSCGIAFALRFMRAATQGGIEIGFGAEMAQYITAQTMKGACELILQSNHHPEKEIDKVTTPRGITISGLNEMEHQGFSSSLIQGLVSSYHKIEKNK
ncbi:MAG: pyrroline-5-carboxylate reductase [Bacteroidota bacterium]|nr:pyrroline-5-carboxylate reductase [Bacteroidota bacterium]